MCEPPPPDSPINTFVVRFWREWSVAGPRWRGQIDHVQSGARANFLDLDEMLGVIQRFGVMARTPRQPNSSEHDDSVARAGRPT